MPSGVFMKFSALQNNEARQGWFRRTTIRYAIRPERETGVDGCHDTEHVGRAWQDGAEPALQAGRADEVVPVGTRGGARSAVELYRARARS